MSTTEFPENGDKSERLGFKSTEERLGYALQLQCRIRRHVDSMMSVAVSKENEAVLADVIQLIDDVLSWTPIITCDLHIELDHMGFPVVAYDYRGAILQLVANGEMLDNFLKQVFLQVSKETVSSLLTAYPEIES